MKLAILVGTRPEIIKLSPLIKMIYSNDFFEPVFIHSGQHYDDEMSQRFLDELKLPAPDYNLEIGSGSHAEQVAKSIMRLEHVLRECKPDLFLVHGDTNTTLGGALAACKMNIPVAHVEAGLRSFDRTMPEEMNRTLVDHIATMLFTQSEGAMNNLKNEGIIEGSCLTGNTIVEACLENLELAGKSDILERVGHDDFALLTLHRQENTNDEKRLREIIAGIGEIDYDVVYPIHPRTKKVLSGWGIKLPGNIKEIEPLGYLDFLKLMSKAKFVMTDSGGIQEEAAVLNVPCLTIRENTERPETVDTGANILVGVKGRDIVKNANKILKNAAFEKKMRAAPNPYGDGKASERIISAMIDKFRTGD